MMMQIRILTVLSFCFLITIGLFQNCGGTKGDVAQPSTSAKTESLTPEQENLILEVVQTINLQGINWSSMTDSEVVAEVVKQLQTIVSALRSDSSQAEFVARMQMAIDLLNTSQIFRDKMVAKVREKAPTTASPSPTPTPTNTLPMCSLMSNPVYMAAGQAATVKFTWQSQNAVAALLRYWNGVNYTSVSVGLNGSQDITLPANFVAGPEVRVFSLVVKNSAQVVQACQTLIEFK